MHDQSNDDLEINSEDVSCITPVEDHPSEGVKGMGTELISADDIDERLRKNKHKQTLKTVIWLTRRLIIRWI